MEIPSYIKQIKNDYILWTQSHPEEMDLLTNLALELNMLNMSLYLQGSAATNEDGETVHDLDLIVFFNEVRDIKTANDLIKNFSKDWKSTKLSFDFIPEAYLFNIEELVGNTYFGLAYFTYLKLNAVCLGNIDPLSKTAFLSENLVIKDSKSQIQQAILGVYKELSKGTTSNGALLKLTRRIIFNSIRYKKYFIYSKKDLFNIFEKEYTSIEDKSVVTLFCDARQKGSDTWNAYDSNKLQTEMFAFVTQLWENLEHNN